MADYVLALDHGTTSTRAILFNHDGDICSVAQREHRQILPHAGWVEHDGAEVWANATVVIAECLSQLGEPEAVVRGVGVTNQRETTIMWDKRTGVPVYNAIVWQDTRTQDLIDTLSRDGGSERIRAITGLPLATYFSGSKMNWILENVEGVRGLAEHGYLMAGTMDSWLVWNLTGGPAGGSHVTDVTNASRTLIMDLTTLLWRDDLAELFSVPMSILPTIVASSAEIAAVVGIPGLEGVPVSGILGDQQAASFGQAAVYPGESKNTFGTSNALLVNVGETPAVSHNGLLSTVAYQLEGQSATYALEGVIAVSGSLIHWLRDNMELISEFSEIEELAKRVDDNGGVYIIPAFSGLFAPYWRSDARGVIVGLTHFVKRPHIARAALEAIGFQSAEIFHAMREDSGADIAEIRVDGGMVNNETLMQFHADTTGIPVIKPAVIESTALGAAYVAGIAVGFWAGLDDIRSNWREDKRWEPRMTEPQRVEALRQWAKAVERSFDWVD
jgi:glycerol kinase